MDLSLIDIIQWGVVVPLGLIWREVRTMQKELQHVRDSRPSREEMDKNIRLSQRPTEVLLEQALERLASIELQQREILNGRNRS